MKRTPLKRGKPLRQIGRRGRRNAPKDRQWKLAVLGRSLGICELCRARNRYLDAHHIEGKQARPDLRHDVQNGAALCRKCHDWCHANPSESKKVLATIRGK